MFPACHSLAFCSTSDNPARFQTLLPRALHNPAGHVGLHRPYEPRREPRVHLTRAQNTASCHAVCMRASVRAGVALRCTQTAMQLINRVEFVAARSKCRSVTWEPFVAGDERHKPAVNTITGDCVLRQHGAQQDTLWCGVSEHHSATLQGPGRSRLCVCMRAAQTTRPLAWLANPSIGTEGLHWLPNTAPNSPGRKERWPIPCPCHLCS